MLCRCKHGCDCPRCPRDYGVADLLALDHDALLGLKTTCRVLAVSDAAHGWFGAAELLRELAGMPADDVGRAAAADRVVVAIQSSSRAHLQ